MNHSTRRVFFLIIFAFLLSAGGCARRQATSTFILPRSTPAPMILPRFTPHVTPFSLAPTSPAAPPTPNASTPRPSPTHPIPISPPTPAPHIHVIQPGETLYDIAVHYQVSLKALARINHITDPTRVKPGDALLIP